MEAKARGQEVFVAAGEHGLRMVSADGAGWRHVLAGKDGEVYRSVCFGKGRAVVLGTYGGDTIFASTEDGAAWQPVLKKGGELGQVRALGFGKDRFLAVGGDAGFGTYARPCVSSSADGVSWGEPRAFPGKSILRRLAFGNDIFVGVGDSGRKATSADGLTWKDAPDVKAADTLIDVCFGKGVFVGVGLHGLRMRSADGLRWTDRQVGEEGEHLNSVLWAAGGFVAVGLGATYFSADGVRWRREKNRNAPLCACFGGGKFLGAHWKGRVLRSSDAISWEEVHKAPHHVETVGFGRLGLPLPASG